MTISMHASVLIHLYFSPSVQLPGTNESPARRRRKIGIRKARYRPMTATDTTA